MDSKSADGLLDARTRLPYGAADEARAGRDSGAAASLDLGERVLAELRLRREHLKQLIRLLDEEARLAERAGLSRSSRHRCRSGARRPV
jgi:hypothetical protein